MGRIKKHVMLRRQILKEAQQQKRLKVVKEEVFIDDNATNGESSSRTENSPEDHQEKQNTKDEALIWPSSSSSDSVEQKEAEVESSGVDVTSGRCCVITCNNTGLHDQVFKYFPFPEQEILRRQWALNMGRMDIITGALFVPGPEERVCSVHFTADQFDPSGVLKPLAIPTLFRLVERKDGAGERMLRAKWEPTPYAVTAPMLDHFKEQQRSRRKLGNAASSDASYSIKKLSIAKRKIQRNSDGRILYPKIAPKPSSKTQTQCDVLRNQPVVLLNDIRTSLDLSKLPKRGRPTKEVVAQRNVDPSVVPPPGIGMGAINPSPPSSRVNTTEAIVTETQPLISSGTSRSPPLARSRDGPVRTVTLRPLCQFADPYAFQTAPRIPLRATMAPPGPAFSSLVGAMHTQNTTAMTYSSLPATGSHQPGVPVVSSGGPVPVSLTRAPGATESVVDPNTHSGEPSIEKCLGLEPTKNDDAPTSADTNEEMGEYVSAADMRAYLGRNRLSAIAPPLVDEHDLHGINSSRSGSPTNSILLTMDQSQLFKELMETKKRMQELNCDYHKLMARAITSQRERDAAMNKLAALRQRLLRCFTPAQVMHFSGEQDWQRLPVTTEMVERALRLLEKCGEAGYNELIAQGYPYPEVDCVRAWAKCLKLGNFADDDEESAQHGDDDEMPWERMNVHMEVDDSSSTITMPDRDNNDSPHHDSTTNNPNKTDNPPINPTNDTRIKSEPPNEVNDEYIRGEPNKQEQQLRVSPKVVDCASNGDLFREHSFHFKAREGSSSVLCQQQPPETTDGDLAMNGGGVSGTILSYTSRSKNGVTVPREVHFVTIEKPKPLSRF